MNTNPQRKSERLAVIVAPFSGNLHSIAKTAAMQLAAIGFCNYIESDGISPDQLKSYDILLIESGFSASFQDILAEQQITIAHRLVLQNLGLEEDDDISEENINLIKDGIEAESIVIDSYTPQFNCPCCG